MKWEKSISAEQARGGESSTGEDRKARPNTDHTVS
jgi:hypothetical protein